MEIPQLEKKREEKKHATISLDKSLIKELKHWRKEYAINFSETINTFLWSMINDFKKQEKTKLKEGDT